MKWISVDDDTPSDGERVLTFSECYDVSDPLRFRMMDGHFVRKCTDVTFWMRIEPPPSEDSAP